MDKTSAIIISLLSLLCAVRWTHSVEIEERSHSPSTKGNKTSSIQYTSRKNAPNQHLMPSETFLILNRLQLGC